MGSWVRLQHISPSTSPNELNTTLTPHSMTHGDACFAYFNKIWGIPNARHHFRLGLLHPSKGTEHALTGYPGEVGVCRFLCIIDMETPGGINLPPANSIIHISVVSRDALDAFGQ